MVNRRKNYCSLKFLALRERSNNLRKGGLALRKFIFIVLSVFLLLSFTALAYAEMDIKLGGRILVRGWYFDGVDLTGGTINTVGGIVIDPSIPFSATYLPVENGHHTIGGEDVEFNSDAASLYTTNAYLTVDAKVTDNLQAFMELETSDTSRTFTTSTSGLYKWGTNDQKPAADLFFRQLWIQYTGSGLLGVPAGIKIGHQLLSLGEKQFLVHERFGDDAILVFVNPTKELLLAGIIDKLSEGVWQDNTDDLDLYAILGTYKLDKDNTLGINYAYVNDSDLDLVFQNLGFHANGLIAGALTYAAEFDIQFGHIFENDAQLDFKGWDFMAKAGYKIDPVNLRASFAIGSGDDEANDDKISEFQFSGGTDAVSPLARYVHYTQIYERTVKTSAWEQLLGGTIRNSGTANTTYYNLGVDLMATKDLNLSLDGFLLRATKSLPGARGSKSIGSELDIKGSYKIAKNLTYFVEAGAFLPGNFYGDTFGIDDSNVTQVIHGINLTF
jgi:hypothetical protein